MSANVSQTHRYLTATTTKYITQPTATHYSIQLTNTYALTHTYLHTHTHTSNSQTHVDTHPRVLTRIGKARARRADKLPTWALVSNGFAKGITVGPQTERPRGTREAAAVYDAARVARQAG